MAIGVSHPMSEDSRRIDWVFLVRGEYTEIPGLSLTKPQIQRLWNFDAPTCDAVVDALERTGFLRQTAAGAYVRATRDG